MFSNNKFRLLLKLIGFERLGAEDIPGALWAIPSTMTSTELREAKQTIDSCLADPITDYQGEDIHQLLKRTKDSENHEQEDHELDHVTFGSDSEGEEEVPDGPLFPPNPREKSTSHKQQKKQKKSRKTKGDKEEPGEETLAERRRRRQENNLARQAKIKSDLYIHASDEESDEEADQEFFRLEEQRGKEQAERIRQALLIVSSNNNDAAKKNGGRKQGQKRKSEAEHIDDEETKRQRDNSNSQDAESDDNDSNTDDGSSVGDADDLLPSIDAELSGVGAEETEKSLSGQDDLDAILEDGAGPVSPQSNPLMED